jgi:TetR/AcrR family transcriptional regulator
MEAKVEDGQIRRERRKQARPGELLDAALALFVEKGFAATRVEEVAARAGVSKGTLFLYFESKEELLKAVVHESLAGRFLEWNEEFERFEGSSADMLRTFLDQWWVRVGSTPASGITKLMISESQNFPELAIYYQREVIVPGHHLIRRILQRGVDLQEFRVDDMEYAVYSVIAPMIFLMMNKHSQTACVATAKALDPLRFIAMQADILLQGLNARALQTPGAT